MDQEGTSWNSDIVVKQEVIIDNEEHPSDLEYYSYLSDNERQVCEPQQPTVDSLDSEETLDADSPIGREQEYSSESSQSFASAFRKKLAAYSSKLDPDDPWHCTMCSHKCKTEKSMIMHIDRHVKNLESGFCCLICLEGFSSEEEFEKHRKTHQHRPIEIKKNRNRNKHFKCNVCQNNFTSPNLLTEHYKNMHGTYRVMGTLNCPGCWKSCTKTSIYAAHVVKHEQFKLCQYFCDTCRMPLLKGDVERHRHRHREGRMSAVNRNVLWRTREDSPDLDGSDTQSIPEDSTPTEEQQQPAGEERAEEDLAYEPDIEQDLPSFAVMKTNGPALAIVKEEVIIDDTEFDEEVW